jgi:hypothetical protein
MGLLSRLFGRGTPPATPVAALELGPTEVEGTGVVLEPLFDPIHGEEAIALHYRASAPGAVGRIYGGLTGSAGDLVIDGGQATDFLLEDSSGAALIRVDPGQDVMMLHEESSQHHGISLSPTVDLLRPGERIRVRGTVVELLEPSPHRRVGYTAIIEAESFERA